MNMRNAFMAAAAMIASLAVYACDPNKELRCEFLACWEVGSCFDPTVFPSEYEMEWCEYNRTVNAAACVDPAGHGPRPGDGETYEDLATCDDIFVWIAATCHDKTDKKYDSTTCIVVRVLEEEVAQQNDGGVDADAGTDNGDAGADANSARAEHCVDNHPDFYVEPQPVWFGPVDQAPKECDPTVGAFGSRNYFDLHIPTSEGCPQCSCGDIEGSCPKNQGTIHFRAGKCDEAQVATTDFSPPENWDGSCTTNHFIDQDAECPAGSGVKCLQSTYMSALPDPIEGCKPVEIPVPKAISDAPKWKQSALSCTPKIEFSTVDSEVCFAFPKTPGWRTCVHAPQHGEYDCTPGSEYSERIVVYPEKAIVDHRSCSACECEASGGSCYGSIRYYSDNACSTLLAQETLSSTGSECHNFYPPGAGIGSKDMGELLYVPGSCEPKGGVPSGDVTVDTKNAVTWCCLLVEPEDM